jgi:uncharacterized protein (TIGR01777 family)
VSAQRKVVVAGSSGFLGRHLCEELTRRGHRVTRLVRRSTSSSDESTWDPGSGTLDAAVVRDADVVVNLAGSPTLGNPHSKKWARELHDSRVRTTALLAETIAEAPSPPAFLAGNAVGWYGDHGSAELTEEADSRGQTLMAQVCRNWQAATAPASDAGARVVVLRTAPVQDRSNPPLKQQRLLFKAGLGGRIGDGRQHVPMMSLRDWVGAMAFLVEEDSASGPVNLCCVRTPTNAEFTEALSRAVGRPALARVPGPLVRAAAGPFSPELLSSVNTVPAVLQRLGYEFADPDVEAVLASGLG